MKSTIKNKLAALVMPGAAALALLGATPNAEGAWYAKFDGVDGSSTAADHKGWVEILSLSQSITRPSRIEPGSPLKVPGDLLVGELTCAKLLDKASPKLAEAICKGTVFPRVLIVLTHEGEPTADGAGEQVYLAYELENVRITSFNFSGSAGGDTLPMEELALNFGGIKVVHTEYGKDGAKGGNVEFEWKVEEGES